ncbi:MAG: gas vesicle protein GvpG [Candidatus Omnitrophica bacterium]|nr:gas vesicle protein GvpG [Candidatus Omnitrophota bacterium]
MFLIDDIFLSPLNLVIWVGKKINEVAEREFSDEGLIKEKLMQLQLRFEMDEISEEEYNKQEKEILKRLDAVRKAKEDVDSAS